MFLVGFPLLLVPFAICNIVAFLMPGVAWTAAVATVHLASGSDWTVSAGDILFVLAVLLVLGELTKSARSKRTLVDRGLSVLLFAGMIAEFALVPQAATATFFLLLVIGFIDVVGGLAVTRRTRASEIAVEHVEHIEPVEHVEPAAS
ncbi:MAG: hypothetical protein ACREB2_13315 [Pseudolabrys sp.]